MDKYVKLFYINAYMSLTMFPFNHVIIFDRLIKV